MRRAVVACLLISGALHALVFLGAQPAAAGKQLELDVPDEVEFGLLEEDPGESGGAKPAAAPPEPAPVAHRPKPPPASVDDPRAIPLPRAVPDAGPPAAVEAETAALPAATDDAESMSQGGAGDGGEGLGPGSGFGAGGFGSGRGGPPGAIIALHADLARIRRTSLILEVEALLDTIPEWQKALTGSGLDPLNDFDRVFVATPNLRRADLVLSGRIRGGETAVHQAVQRLAQERGLPAARKQLAGMRLWPWHDRGPTDRVLGLFGKDQFVIAQPGDVDRVLAVSAALERRHARQPGMERAAPPGSLLAMYEGEGLALSVEGVRTFLRGQEASYAPPALRLSIRHLDEFHAKLIAYGYYRSAAAAASALSALDALRTELLDHPRVSYLGLRSAMEEAVIEQHGDTVTLEAKLTMHQTRYMLKFVNRALSPRKGRTSSPAN